MHGKLRTLILLAIFLGLMVSVHAEDIVLFDSIEEQVVVDYKDNNDPAEGYIRKMMYPQSAKLGLLRGSVLIGDRLEGINKKLYLCLKAEIIEIAAGTRASSVILIPVSNLYEKYIYKGRSWCYSNCRKRKCHRRSKKRG